MFKIDLRQKSHEISSIKYSFVMQYFLKIVQSPIGDNEECFKRISEESHIQSGLLIIVLVLYVY